VEIAFELLCQCKPSSVQKLTDRDYQDLQSFANGQRGYEVNILPVWKVVSASLFRNGVASVLSNLERSVLLTKVIQKRSWSEVADESGLKGRAEVISIMRTAIHKIIQRY